MSRIKLLDTRTLTVQEVVKDFGWKEPFVMFDDKFPYRTIVDLSGDYEHVRELRKRVEVELISGGIQDGFSTLSSPEQFSKVLTRLIQ